MWLTSIVLGLGAAVVLGALLFATWRLVTKAPITHMKITTSVGHNRSGDVGSKRGALFSCSDTRSCADAYTAILLESMDASVSPCHNFYEYACGGWRHSHKMTSTAFSAWRHYTVDVIERLYSEKVASSMRKEPVGQAAQFLEACINIDNGDGQGATALTELKTVLAEGGLTWPDRSESSDLIGSVFFMARRVALPVLFGVDLGYTKYRLRAIYFPLDAAFQETARRLWELVKTRHVREFVHTAYHEMAVEGIVNETRINEIVNILESMAVRRARRQTTRSSTAFYVPTSSTDTP
ncbi:hypothetical protein V5799_003602 [Amblyomma americanum]|uniref:Peptidase M13 N-terminal domain-containing protein n=1 Tax=Amblyomma americanum TaxID=6943 RepID=A0AAQ4D8I0_AMBAM